MSTKSSSAARVILFGFVLAAGTVGSQAQSYAIDWYAIPGGGSASTNGSFALNGSIGQASAGGPMTNGQFSVTGGFWAPISAVQTPGAPPLYISYSANTVTVFWQNTAGWNLQQNNNLTAMTNWSLSSGVTTSAGTNYLNLVHPAGNLFFRLDHQ